VIEAALRTTTTKQIIERDRKKIIRIGELFSSAVIANGKVRQR